MFNEKEFISYDQLKNMSNEKLKKEYYHLKHMKDNIKKDLDILEEKIMDIKHTLKNRNVHYIKSEAEVLAEF